MKNSTKLIREEKNTWEEYYSSREVEKILGIGRDSLNRYCCDGKITYSKPNNGKRMFKRSVVERFLDRNTFLSKEDIKGSI